MLSAIGDSMYLYKIADGENIQKITEHKVEREEIIQDLITSNLYGLLQIQLIREYHNISVYGQIDALGLDDDFRPVIIEFKKENKPDVIDQALDYAHWLINNTDSFTQLALDKRRDLFEKTEEETKTPSEIDYKNFRVIIIGKNFTRRQRNAAEVALSNIELIDYRYFKLNEEKILGLDYVSKEPISPREELSIDYYFKGKKKKLRELFDLVEEKLKKSLSEDIELYTRNKRSIGYKTGRRKFIAIYPLSNKLSMGFYFGDKGEEIVDKHQEDIRPHNDGWIYYDINNENDIENAIFIDLLKGAFEYSS